MIKIIALLLVLSFNASAFSMTCLESLSNSGVKIKTQTNTDKATNWIKEDHFEVASAILEQAFFNHSIRLIETSDDKNEFLFDRQNQVLKMRTYKLELSKGGIIHFQLKHVLRSPSEHKYFSVTLTDPDSNLRLFDDKYDFLAPFYDISDLPMKPKNQIDPDFITSFENGRYSLQIFDAFNPSYQKGMPLGIEMIFVDFSKKDYTIMEYQEALWTLMSSF